MQNGNLTILDPIWTTAYVTRDHGYMIYDTLFSTDEKNEVKPQMVDKYEVSPDKTLWTFTPRDGLEWHDGQPVTAEDCVVSIKRWAARDSMGRKLMEFVTEVKPVDAKTFTHQAQGAVRPGARFARQAVVQRALHDAQGDRCHRSVRAKIGFQVGSGPVHLPDGFRAAAAAHQPVAAVGDEQARDTIIAAGTITVAGPQRQAPTVGSAIKIAVAQHRADQRSDRLEGEARRTSLPRSRLGMLPGESPGAR